MVFLSYPFYLSLEVQDPLCGRWRMDGCLGNHCCVQEEMMVAQTRVGGWASWGKVGAGDADKGSDSSVRMLVANQNACRFL